MLHFIDQLVLSQVQKVYQFLQKYLELKLRYIIEGSMMVFTITCWALWYSFKDIPPSDISALVATMVSLITVFVLYYICVLSTRDQAAAEKRALKGVSNPTKRIVVFALCRVLTSLVLVIHFRLLYLFGFSDTTFMYTFLLVSYWTASHLMAIDILPDPQAKQVVD